MGYTVPGTAVVGGIATASLWNAGVRDNMQTAIPHLLKPPKGADESVTSSIVLQDDNDLFFALAINEIWYVRFILYVIDNSSSTADIKTAFTWPSGTTAALSLLSTNIGDTFTRLRTYTTSGASIASDCSLAGDVFDIHGIVTAGGTAGNLQLQWAQNVSSASSVVVKKGSCIFGVKLA